MSTGPELRHRHSRPSILRVHSLRVTSCRNPAYAFIRGLLALSRGTWILPIITLGGAAGAGGGPAPSSHQKVLPLIVNGSQSCGRTSGGSSALRWSTAKSRRTWNWQVAHRVAHRVAAGSRRNLFSMSAPEHISGTFWS